MRIGIVVLVGVVAVVVALLLRPPERPDVAFVDWFTAEVATAPPAPTGPLVRRWSHALPVDHELVGMATVGDRVVLASRPRAPAGSDDPRPATIVAGLDPIDGSRDWRTSVGATSAVVVADDDSTVLLSDMDDIGGVAGRILWDRDGLVVVDPADGAVRSRRSFAAGDATVEVRPDGTLLVRQSRRVSTVDPLTGTDELTFPAVPGPTPDAPPRQARRAGDAWAVPTADGWQITDNDGHVEFSVTGQDLAPTIVGDLVVTGSDSVLAALRRPDGVAAWHVELAGTVRWVEPVGHRPPWAGQDEPVRLAAHVAGSDGPDTTDATFLVEDGRLRGEVADAAAPGSAGAGSRLLVEVDGRDRRVCRRLPVGIGGGDPACPGELALLDGSGTVLAVDDSVLASHHDPSRTWTATDRGLLSVERDAVRLYDWDGLDEAWAIPVDGSSRRPVRVATTAGGVAVASNDAVPATVTWYR